MVSVLTVCSSCFCSVRLSAWVTSAFCRFSTTASGQRRPRRTTRARTRSSAAAACQTVSELFPQGVLGKKWHIYYASHAMAVEQEQLTQSWVFWVELNGNLKYWCCCFYPGRGLSVSTIIINIKPRSVTHSPSPWLQQSGWTSSASRGCWVSASPSRCWKSKEPLRLPPWRISRR